MQHVHVEKDIYVKDDSANIKQAAVIKTNEIAREHDLEHMKADLHLQKE